MYSMTSHYADAPNSTTPTTVPEHPTPNPLEIPLCKRNLWQNLKQVKAMSFKKIDKNIKRKTTVEDLISGVGSLIEALTRRSYPQ